MKNAPKVFVLSALAALTLSPPAHAGWVSIPGVPSQPNGTYQPPTGGAQPWAYTSGTEYLNTVTNATNQIYSGGTVGEIYYEWDSNGTTPTVGQTETLTYTLSVTANGYIPGNEQNGGQNLGIGWDYWFGSWGAGQYTTYTSGFSVSRTETATAQVQWNPYLSKYTVEFSTVNWSIQSETFPTGSGAVAEYVLVGWSYSATGVAP